MSQLLRKYSISDTELMFLIGDFVVFIHRDADKFLQRGVDNAEILAFEALGNAFEVFPIDNYYRASITGEAEAKTAARESCYRMIQRISGFVEQQWGLGSWQYKKLSIKNLWNKRDGDFINTCRNVVESVSGFMSELSLIGLTQAELVALDAEADLIVAKIQAVIDKKAIRDAKAEERIEKGNELYSYLKKYSALGKLIWENISEAKYNDYLIYHKSSSSRKKKSKPDEDVS